MPVLPMLIAIVEKDVVEEEDNGALPAPAPAVGSMLMTSPTAADAAASPVAANGEPGTGESGESDVSTAEKQQQLPIGDDNNNEVVKEADGGKVVGDDGDGDEEEEKKADWRWSGAAAT